MDVGLALIYLPHFKIYQSASFNLVRPYRTLYVSLIAKSKANDNVISADIEKCIQMYEGRLVLDGYIDMDKRF